MNVINVITQTGNYDIDLGSGLLKNVGELLKLNRKVLIVTDDGVPKEYSEAVAKASKEPVTLVIKQGEESKNLDNLMKLEKTMLEAGFTRGDCVVAVGGGVIGDLSGFAASIYMRGIDFYNIPTTVLSQVDSSIGGKTAVNLGNIKNIVGSFYQPEKVLADVEVLRTLSDRQVAEGLAEALKMSVTFDPELFALFEAQPAEKLRDEAFLQQVTERALQIKKRVVEEDVTEQGLRKALNFGHTIGHGIESLCLDGRLFHGECVAIGMIPMCSPEVRERLLPVLRKLGLPVSCGFTAAQAAEGMAHDKKGSAGTFTIIKTDRIGTFYMKTADIQELTALAAEVCGKEEE